MTADNILGLAIAAVIIVYLVLALIHPERF
ncbi:potassium-transporting ATPase subunit F [Streptomyces sp. NPDC056231]